MKTDMRFIVLTGNKNRHRYFANAMIARLPVEGVISEQVYQAEPPASAEDAELVTRHFEERDRAENKYFPASGTFNTTSLLSIAKGDLHQHSTLDWIQAKAPTHFILYGSSIVKPALLHLAREGVFNMHLGLSPYYKGSGTNFWPLVDGCPECIGATILQPTATVDGGPVLRQVRPPVSPDDQCHDLGCKTILQGTDCMISAVLDFLNGSIQAHLQPNTGKVFKRRDFTAEALRKMYKNFNEGMIPNYIDRKKERDAAFPIVD